MCLVLTASYGLVNSNSKWQHLGDSRFLSIGFKHTSLIPLHLIMGCDGTILALAAKLLDDILLF